MQRAKAYDEQDKIDAFNLDKNKKQLSQGLQALSNNAKRVKFQKNPENKKTIELAQKNKKINHLQQTYNSPSHKPLKPPEIKYKSGGRAKTVVEVLPEPQPSPKKVSSSSKSDKTDVASYMGSNKSDLDDIKVKKGHHPSTQAALENHQQQKLEAGLPKYAISLEVVKRNYDDANPKEFISDDVKREVNSRTGKSFFPIKEKITVDV